MKIALLIYGSLDTLSGGYLYDRQLVDHLRAAGCQVDIWSLPWRSYLKHLSDNLRLGWLRTLANEHYDLILQDELNHPSLFLLNVLLRRMVGSPIVSIVHHLRSSEEHAAWLMPLYRWIEYAYLNQVDGFIFNSQTTHRSVQRRLHHPRPYVIAYPAADHRTPPGRAKVIDALAERLKRQSALQLLFVGNLIERKGLHHLIAALARLPMRDWHLHVVGDPTVDPAYNQRVRRQASALGLDNMITWHGRLSDGALNQRLAASDLLVLPSYEGFGIVFLEAMAYGLPVVATNVGAAHEIIEPGVNGYLVTHDDTAGLAQTLDLLVKNRVHLATLGYGARMRYEQHPTWHKSMHSAFSWLCEMSKNPRLES